MHTGAGAYTDPTHQSPRSRASRGTPTGLRSTSVEASTHRSRPTHRRAGADQRLSQATHFMAFMAAFMAFFAKTALFASAPTVFIAFIAFIAFAMARREVSEDTGISQSTGRLS